MTRPIRSSSEDDADQSVTVRAMLSVQTDEATEVKVSVAKNTDRYAITVDDGGDDTNEFTITVGANTSSNTGMFVINPTDDDDYMGDVTVAITGTAGTLTVKDTELRLEDEDFDIELTVDQASLAIEEAGGTQSVTVTATAPADLDDATTVELWIVRPEGLDREYPGIGRNDFDHDSGRYIHRQCGYHDCAYRRQNVYGRSTHQGDGKIRQQGYQARTDYAHRRGIRADGHTGCDSEVTG